jgi:hypothetical protein
MDIQDLNARLKLLHQDLRDMPQEMECPAGVARIFNLLLAEVRQIRAEDPVVKVVSALRPVNGDEGGPLPSVGAARALTGQLGLALGGDRTGR